ncbi:MAG: phosphoribosyl-ATP diphosphatase [Clostridium sp.]|jgi:phosphoribosyl-ATP pyrophosphohydrolase|nr:phosphoribosyl-ATP diphosphatase [Clostridium sp.]
MQDEFKALYATILSRRTESAEGSYTGYLFAKGTDKILKKCGEECAETIIAAKNGDKNELILELSDLFFHLHVLMAQMDVSPDDIAAELAKRAQKSGNLKQMRVTDKNT